MEVNKTKLIVRVSKKIKPITYFGKKNYRRFAAPSLFQIYKKSLMLHEERQEVSRCQTLLA